MRTFCIIVLLAASALARPQDATTNESTTAAPVNILNEGSTEEVNAEVSSVPSTSEVVAGRNAGGSVTVLGDQFTSSVGVLAPSAYSSFPYSGYISNRKQLFEPNFVNIGNFGSSAFHYSSPVVTPNTYSYSAPLSTYSGLNYVQAADAVEHIPVTQLKTHLQPVTTTAVQQHALDSVHHVDVDRVVPVQSYTVQAEKVQVPVQKYVQTEKVVPVKYDTVQQVQDYENVAVRTAVPVQKYSVQNKDVEVPVQTLVRSEEIQQFRVESVTPVSEVQRFQIQKVIPVVSQQIKTEEVEVPVQRFVKSEQFVPVRIEKVTPVQQTQRVSVQHVVPEQHVEYQTQNVQVPVQRLVKSQKIEHVRVQGVTPVPDVETHEIQKVVPVSYYQVQKEKVAIPVRQIQNVPVQTTHHVPVTYQETHHVPVQNAYYVGNEYFQGLEDFYRYPYSQNNNLVSSNVYGNSGIVSSTATPFVSTTSAPL